MGTTGKKFNAIGDGRVMSALKTFTPAQILRAKSNTEIEAVSEAILKLPSLKFSHILELVLIAAGCLGLGFLIFGTDSPNIYLVFAAFAVVTAGVCIMAYKRSVRSSRLDAIMKRAAHLAYGISDVQSFSPRALADQFARKYASFTLGDEERKVKSISHADFSIGGMNAGFSFYTYSYVVVTYVQTKNGRRKQRTTHTHNGIIITGLDFIPRMELLSAYGRKWGTISPYKWHSAMKDFNKLYKVACSDEFACARFLNPVTLLELERLSQGFHSLSIESLGGEFNMTFRDGDILGIQTDMHGAVANPAKLCEVLRGGAVCPKLDFIFDRLLKIKEFNDKNF